MKSEYTIQLGDFVSVNFHNAQVTLSKRAEVLSLPYNPGESWVVKDVETKIIHYISEGCTITKLLT